MKWLEICISFVTIAVIQVQCRPLATQRTNIRQITTIQDLQFSVDPWTLETLSRFQLDFRLSHDVKRIRFGLKPSSHDANSDADAQHLDVDKSDDFNDIPKNPILLFTGDAFLFDSESRSWRKAGWTRIMVDPLRPFLFEGVFALDDDRYHVLLDSSYRKIRLAGEPSPPKSGSSHMVVWSQPAVIENDLVNDDL
ncbi:hypothetical protein FDECE_911 [Fusarium decemcellulare]|nr:hypothetical protein FDECE_911 [Fusarium decemcellulare]